MKRFYVTTAIDYPNAEPHIGHAYQKIVADVISRYHKLKGDKVFFLTGTDEHGKKIQEAAEKIGKKPREFVDEMSEKFKKAWKFLDIDYNRFIRTTDKDHEKIVQDVIKKCSKNGDIYKGTYEGLYCVGCEAYYTEKDLVNGCCPIHGRPVERLSEESYFFKLSKYQNFLLDLYKKDFVLPKERKNEIISRVKEGLKDLSISRTSFSWGIPFPNDKKHVVYVWMDALFNYYTGAGKKQEFWPADIHLLGKDNGWFHAVYWPAFLKSAGLKLPKTVFIHGFLTFNGEKISKSLGNAISPIHLVEKYSSDSIRYFVCRQFPFAEGNDGDFSEKALVERHNNELADKYGNLISRVSALAENYGIQRTENKLIKKLKIDEIKKDMDEYQLDKALTSIFAFIDQCNLYVQDNKLWESKDKKKLYELIDSIKAVTILLSPFMPKSCKAVSENLGFKININEITKQYKPREIKKSPILFKKYEIENINKEKNSGIITMTEIKGIVDYASWEKIDLRVGKILEVDDIEGADKLYKLIVDVGNEKRTICAGLKQHYTKEKLKGKKVIVFINLQPRKMRGIESNGMLLAAVNSDESKVTLIKPEEDIEVGSKVR